MTALELIWHALMARSTFGEQIAHPINDEDSPRVVHAKALWYAAEYILERKDSGNPVQTAYLGLCGEGAALEEREPTPEVAAASRQNARMSAALKEMLQPRSSTITSRSA
jgi:hypothetical protein